MVGDIFIDLNYSVSSASPNFYDYFTNQSNSRENKHEVHLVNVGFLNGEIHITELTKTFSKSLNGVVMDITLSNMLSQNVKSFLTL
jgi:hypothetical protein